jgi:hypothetical protein
MSVLLSGLGRQGWHFSPSGNLDLTIWSCPGRDDLSHSLQFRHEANPKSFVVDLDRPSPDVRTDTR